MLKIILVLGLAALKVQCCPTDCNCFMDIVDCANRGLTVFPTGIPPSSVELFLQGNAISELKAEDFAGLSKLQYIYLQNNAIATIGATTFKLSAATLVTLDLHGNEIGELPAGVFEGMAQLKVLNLNENKLKVIGDGLFADLVSATQISFYDNLVETLNPDAFGEISALWYLGVANNKLTSVPDNFGSTFPDLYSIDFSGNELATLPVIPPTHVQLYLNDNNIAAVPLGALDNASSLYEVFLANNRISEIQPHSFHGAPNLAWLDLSGNEIAEVTAHTFMHSTFEGLYLNGNRLRSVDRDAFVDSRSTMTRLRLNDNELAYIDASVMSQLTNNGLYVWLGSNPWQCGCELKGLGDYVASNGDRVTDLDEMFCSRGTPLSEFDFAASCAVVVPPSDNLALIISLPIVGAILLFLVVSYVVYRRSRKNTQKLSVDADEHGYSEIKYGDHKNPAYDHDTGF